MTERDKHFLYIMGHVKPDGIAPPIKVGTSSNPRARLATINTSSPHPIKLICALQMPARSMAEGLEKEMHEKFGEFRQNGEWFDADPMSAADWLCQVYERLLLLFMVHKGRDWDFYRGWVYGSGLKRIQRMVEAERYCRTWEAQVAA